MQYVSISLFNIDNTQKSQAFNFSHLDVYSFLKINLF